MKKNLSLASIFIFWALAVNGQSTSDELERLRQLVNKNEQIAKENERKAILAENRVIALEIENKILERANKTMRYLAVADALAEQSLEMQDKELSALLAVQAHNFSVSNNGYRFNAKIYNALFNALKKNGLYPNDSEVTKSHLRNISDKPIFSAALPNGKFSVVADQNGNLKFVGEQGSIVRVLGGHRAQVDRITFSNSGSLMATSGKDNSIRIWNLGNINQRPMVITETDPISKLTFSPDDNQIMYMLGTQKATFSQLPLDMKLMATQLCNVLTRNLTVAEWSTFVSDDLTYEQTCTKNPPNNK